jgi:hypothetical protein
MSLDGTIIIAAFLGIPLMTLAHELGHAGTALWLTKGRVSIRVGTTQGALRTSLGRLVLAVSPFGAGGYCSRERQGTRGQALTIALAGPAMSAVCAMILIAAGSRATGQAEAVCYTLAVISGLHVLNLIPRRGAWNPITRNLPSDGLKAWCLIRNKPIPPPKPSNDQVGFKGDLTGGQIVIVLLGGVAGAVASAAHLAGAGLSFYLPYVLQGYLSKSSGKAQAQKQAQVATGSPQAARTRVRAPGVPLAAVSPVSAGAGAGISLAGATTGAMKTCPRCGAQVQSRTSLCYCYHNFDEAPVTT